MIKLKNLLVENPEYVYDEHGYLVAKFRDKDAVTFGYARNKFHAKAIRFSEYVWQTYHSELYPNYYRDQLKFPGRLWFDKKIISFWGKYPSRYQLGVLIKDIIKWNSQLSEPIVQLNSININSSEWEIEIPSDGGMYKYTFVLLKDYKVTTNSQFNDVEHMKPPSAKRRKTIKGFGSKKRPADMTATQYHQMISTSENVDD